MQAIHHFFLLSLHGFDAILRGNIAKKHLLFVIGRKTKTAKTEA